LFGASRGAGLALAQRLRARGAAVTALVRTPAAAADLEREGVRVVLGDALERGDVGRAFAAAPAGAAVVSTLGGRVGDRRLVDDEGNAHVIDLARTTDATRLVLVTAIGCGAMAPHRSEPARAAFGAVVDAKTRAEERLRRSGLPYTIVRPGGLRDGPATGRGLLTEDPTVHGFIHRAELAALIERVLRDLATLGRALAAVDEDQVRGPAPSEPFPLVD
jgi:uncharacterized protein YbjT (DUF2867 family)